MQNSTVLFDDGTHKCIMFSIDNEEEGDFFLSVNQFLIIQNNSAILIDPGSEASFEELSESIQDYISLEQIKYIFFSHQDPDVAGSITNWSVITNAKFVISKLWVRFLSHYGFMDAARLVALEDKGAKVDFGENYLKFLPAHFLHSPGNFSVYDSRSKILFSGDIGAAIVPHKQLQNSDVKQIQQHIEYMDGFHKRYMASNKACNLWLKYLQDIDVDMIAPQHGAVIKGQIQIDAFKEWFKNLQCGLDLME